MKHHIPLLIAIVILFSPMPALAQDATPPEVAEAKRRADELAQDARDAQAQSDAAQAEAAQAKQNASAAQVAADRAREQAVRLESEAASRSANEASTLASAAAQTAILADQKAQLARAKSGAIYSRAILAETMLVQQRARLTEVSASLADTSAQLEHVRREMAVSNARAEILLKTSLGLFALLVLGTIAVLLILRRQSELIVKTIAAAAESMGESRPPATTPAIIDSGAAGHLRIRHIDRVRGDLLERLEALFNE